MSKSIFEILVGVDVTPFLKKKKTGGTELSYLSWAKAWELLLKHYPEATCSVREWNGVPYLADPIIGYFVETSVTINGLTRTMRLPVLDGANKAMRDVSYEYQTKNGLKYVEAADAMDINTATQRCLVKTIALFGLGLSVYIGEDLTERDETKKGFIVPKKWKGKEWLSPKQYNDILTLKTVSEFMAAINQAVDSYICSIPYRDNLQKRLDELVANQKEPISFIDNYVLNTLQDVNECAKAIKETHFASDNDANEAKIALYNRATELGFKPNKEKGCYE